MYDYSCGCMFSHLYRRMMRDANNSLSPNHESYVRLLGFNILPIEREMQPPQSLLPGPSDFLYPLSFNDQFYPINLCVHFFSELVVDDQGLLRPWKIYFTIGFFPATVKGIVTSVKCKLINSAVNQTITLVCFFYCV